MPKTYFVVGKEGPREYKDKSTGLMRTYCGLHCVLEGEKKDDLQGNAVQTVSIKEKKLFDSLKVGARYTAVIEARGRYAEIVDFTEIVDV